MKIRNMGIDYKVVRLKGKSHTCAGCVARNTYDLCNELRAQYWGKYGKVCSVKVVFRAIPAKTDKEEMIQQGIHTLDRGKKALLVNYMNYLDGCLPYLESGKLDRSQVKILSSYHKKLRLAFKFPPKGDCDGITQAS